MIPLIEQLREKARKATPGPWVAEEEFEVITTVEQRNPGRPSFPVICVTTVPYQQGHDLPDEAASANTEHIAAANPKTILKLLDAIEVMREALDEIGDKTISWAQYSREALHLIQKEALARAEEILK